METPSLLERRDYFHSLISERMKKERNASFPPPCCRYCTVYRQVMHTKWKSLCRVHCFWFSRSGKVIRLTTFITIYDSPDPGRMGRWSCSKMNIQRKTLRLKGGRQPACNTQNVHFYYRRTFTSIIIDLFSPSFPFPPRNQCLSKRKIHSDKSHHVFLRRCSLLSAALC